jgi:phosphatidylglycerol:prolipoprotein diacylglycerol transferase
MPVGFSFPAVYLQALALVIAVIGFVTTLASAFRNSQPVDLGSLFTWLVLGIGAGISFFLVENAVITVRYYGVIIMSGAIAGGLLAGQRLKQSGRSPEIVGDLLIWLVVGGVIGARLWHVFTPSPSALVPDPLTGQMVNPYFAGGKIHFFDILFIWEGGLGIPGAVIGGLAALLFFCRKYGESFSFWVDIASPSLALGQAIGRWGNFFNEELYGAPTNLPWKLYISPLRRLPEFLNVEYYHPLFLYESLWNLANMFFLIWLSRRFLEHLKPGDVFLAYLVIYPLGRFWMDFLRLDASLVGGVNVNQMFMAVVAVCAAAALAWRHRPGAAAAR